jgi:L-2,4-diaminobutyrate decarboxylase
VRVAAASGPFTGVTAAELEPVVGAIDLDAPLGDSGAALDELDRVYLRDAVYFHHPRYLAHLNCPVVIPALLGEVVLSGVNSSLDTWDQSAGGTLIERRLIDWTARRIGFGPGRTGCSRAGGRSPTCRGCCWRGTRRCVGRVVRVVSGLRCCRGCGFRPRRARTSAW